MSTLVRRSHQGSTGSASIARCQLLQQKDCLQPSNTVLAFQSYHPASLLQHGIMACHQPGVPSAAMSTSVGAAWCYSAPNGRSYCTLSPVEPFAAKGWAFNVQGTDRRINGSRHLLRCKLSAGGLSHGVKQRAKSWKMTGYTNERDAAKEALEKFRRLETQVIFQH